LKKLLVVTIVALCTSVVTFAQRSDTVVYRDSTHAVRMQVYNVDGKTFYYPKPKFWFVTKLPATYPGAVRMAFRKESIKPWIIVAASTAILLQFDQKIANEVQRFSRFINVDNTRIYHHGLSFKLGKTSFDVYEPPGNVNTFIYEMGEGVPSLLIAAGFWGFGLGNKDYRAISTASQIVQATTATGFMTQFLKRTTGRESPFRKSQDGGKWRPFPKPSVYQHSVPMYDAFPSGHMGTMMSTYVVITENYPEKRWIHPVGLSIISLVGLAMINNDVHWASDYPLAMGYAFGKATVKMNRFIRGEPLNGKKRRR
jgi:hypothetical protein